MGGCTWGNWKSCQLWGTRSPRQLGWTQWGHWWCVCLCECWLHPCSVQPCGRVSTCLCVCVYMCPHVLFVCALTGNTHTALLLVGYCSMELQQPLIYQATKFSNPLTSCNNSCMHIANIVFFSSITVNVRLNWEKKLLTFAGLCSLLCISYFHHSRKIKNVTGKAILIISLSHSLQRIGRERTMARKRPGNKKLHSKGIWWKTIYNIKALTLVK